MKYPATIACLAVLVVPQLLLCFPVTGDGQPPAAPAVSFWYDDWFRDGNRNGLDDLLENRAPSERVNVFVDFITRPGECEMNGLRPFCTLLHDAVYIDTLAMYDVLVSDLETVSEYPGVVMVEYQPDVLALLDISVPSLRVRSSETYPAAVWQALNITGAGANVAIIDTGVDNRFHESLDDQDDNAGTSDPKYVAGYDCSGTIWVEGDPEDNDGHGSHCAGVAIGTGGPSHAYSGIAPSAGLIDIKVMSARGSAPAGKVIEAIRWAIEHQAQYNISVLSMSLGTSVSSDGNDAVSQMANQASRGGMAVVVAVGNDGPSNTGIGAPGAADEAITVAATDDHGTITRVDDNSAYFSSRGPRASDGDLNRTDELKPELSAPGTNIMSVLAHTAGSYVSFSGTSMACPHIAGVCALLHSANPALNPREMKQILKETAESRDTPYNTSLDPRYNTAYGYGIADGYGAVRRAQDLTTARMDGPQVTESGSSQKYSLLMSWTRTEFTKDRDCLFFNVTVPGTWGKPQTPTFDTGAISGEVTPINVVSSGGNWTLTGWLNYTGTPQKPTNLTPALKFNTFAPAVTQNTSFTLSGRVEANRIHSSIHNFTVTAVPAGLLKPDLSVSQGDVYFSPMSPSSGENTTLHTRVTNKGTAGVPAVVAFYDGPPSARTELGRAEVSVPSGGEDVASLYWNASAGTHRIFARADPDNLIVETNEKNNEANATISVSGSNQAPILVFNVSSYKARTGEPVMFDASPSSDPDGLVVYYRFEFGDGTDTGYTTNPKSSHSYSQAASFTATITIQDNGAQDARADTGISVTETVKRSVRYYFQAQNELTPMTPPDGPNLTAPCPGPSSSYADVGTWKSHPLGKDVVINESVFVLSFRNSGNTTVSSPAFEIILLSGSSEINRTSVTMSGLGPGETREIMTGVEAGRTLVPGSSQLGVQLRAKTSSSSVAFLYGALASESLVFVTMMDPPDLPPMADAGLPVTGRVGDPIRLNGRGFDIEGAVTAFEWDFEGDGKYDWSGASGELGHVYPASGVFNAMLRVQDFAGAQSTDTVKVTVLESNRPPAIVSVAPAGSVSLMAGNTQLFSVQASDLDGDTLSYSWALDSSALDGQTGQSCLFRATNDQVGKRTLTASVSDGNDTARFSWELQILRRNDAPRITAQTPDSPAIAVDENTQLSFAVAVTDPDGDRLIYRWYLDQIAAGSLKEFSYLPDYTASGTHDVTVVVSDGTLNATASWAVTVKDVNRLPSVRILSPGDGSIFTEGMEILFECKATDADRDALEYSWSSDKLGRLGDGPSLSRTLNVGTHRIRLAVSDGKDESIAEFVIIVKPKPVKPGATTPGFEALLLLSCLALCATVSLARRRAH